MAMIITRTDELTELRYKWLRENRGTLAKIASDLSVSHGKVRTSYFGFTRTIDARVAEALAEAGAPGFSKQKRVA
jgi:hypothetical protein